MLVRVQFGSSAGDVVDFLPHEARAMLADGRAVLPDSVPVTTATVSMRSDRGMPDGKRRATR